MSSIQNRYDFVYFFDVKDGNPNGDPDAGNLPRVDPETNQGLVTDVCLKRKIRNYVSMAKEGVISADAQQRYAIYIQERAILNQTNEKAYSAVGLQKSKKLPDGEKGTELRKWICDNYFDIRTFGAVMSTGEFNCGQIRGPIQLTFARSIEPVSPIEVSITRMAVTSQNEADKQDENRTMGRKHILPYGLYRAHGFISARLANDATKGTGFSEADLDLFWQALENMFEHDRSAARGEMNCQRLLIFEHDNDLGNAQAQALFKRVDVKRNGEQAGKTLPPARSIEDYLITLDSKDLPPGITVYDGYAEWKRSRKLSSAA
jgi:CRISPR-associated protein Csd2